MMKSPAQKKKLSKEEKIIQKAQVRLSMSEVGSPEYKKAKSVLSKMDQSQGRTGTPMPKKQPTKNVGSRDERERVLSPSIKQAKREGTPQKTAIRHSPRFENDLEYSQMKPKAQNLNKEGSQLKSGYERTFSPSVQRGEFQGTPQKNVASIHSPAGQIRFDKETVSSASKYMMVSSPSTKSANRLGSTPQKAILCSPNTHLVFVDDDENVGHYVAIGQNAAPKTVGFQLADTSGVQPGEGATRFSRVATPHPKKAKALVPRSPSLHHQEALAFDNDDMHVPEVEKKRLFEVNEFGRVEINENKLWEILKVALPGLVLALLVSVCFNIYLVSRN